MAYDLILLRICCFFSIISTILIILLYFFSLDLQKTTFHRIIFYISICDLFSVIGFILGFPKEDSILCWLQALLTNIFPVSSVFWITIISYMLYINVFRRENSNELLSWKVYLVCWIFPILISFLPLTTNKFGPLNKRSGMCFIDTRKNSPDWTVSFWVVFSFYFWIWAAIGIYFLLFILLSIKVNEIYRLYQEETNPMSNNGGVDLRTQVKTTLNKFIWYPINVIICWTLPTVYDIMSTKHEHYRGHNVLDQATDLLPTLLGFLNVVAFISTNTLAREKIHNLFTHLHQSLCCSQISLFSRKSTLLSEFERSSVPVEPSTSSLGRSTSNKFTNKSLQMFESYASEHPSDL